MDHRTLLTRVWGPAYAGDRNYLRTFVQRLRRSWRRIPPTPGGGEAGRVATVSGTRRAGPVTVSALSEGYPDAGVTDMTKAPVA